MAKIYDPIRKKEVELTPEERVRQQTIKWLMEGLKIPAHQIEVEFSFSKIIPGDLDQADIVVWDFTNPKVSAKKPYLLVECKRPEVKFSQAIQDQVQRYLNKISPLYVAITNGYELRLFKLVENKYQNVSEFT